MRHMAAMTDLQRRVGMVAQHMAAESSPRTANRTATAAVAEDRFELRRERTVLTSPQEMQEYFKGVANGSRPIDPKIGGAGGGNPGNNPRHSEGYTPGQGQSQLQGYGILGKHPIPFDTGSPREFDKALDFYKQNGFVVVQALSPNEVTALNAATDNWVRERGSEIDFPGQGQLFFPLLAYPECDITTAHPKVFPLLSKIFGGEEHIRHVEFNWRGWPSSDPDAPGPRGMQFHPDTDGNTADGDVTRFTRVPYGVPNFVSTFYYLTDVDDTTPAFCAVPKSRRAATLMDAREQLGDDYAEVPIRGPAGTCCIIDYATVSRTQIYWPYAFRSAPVHVHVAQSRRIY